MPTALFLSPHLDDVAFSCGGTLILLARAGWDVRLCTAFTASVAAPVGFALACQTDKGLSPEVDYMALRRAEDLAFARIAGLAEPRHLEYREAPHRGYESAAALFAGARADDDVYRPIAAELGRLAERLDPGLVFAPQGLGGHVDHLLLIRAVTTAGLADRACWYRDTPYAIRASVASPSPLLPPGLRERGVAVDAALPTKVDGACAYTTQIGFQFGGPERLRAVLPEFHRAEAERLGLVGTAEALLVPPETEPSDWLEGRSSPYGPS